MFIFSAFDSCTVLVEILSGSLAMGRMKLLLDLGLEYNSCDKFGHRCNLTTDTLDKNGNQKLKSKLLVISQGLFFPL